MKTWLKVIVVIVALNIVSGVCAIVYRKYAPAASSKPNTLTAAQSANLAAINSAISAAMPVAAVTAPTTSAGPAARSYTPLTGLDSSGNDISSSTVTGGVPACNASCDNTPGCVATSYGTDSQTCWLKAQVAGASVNANRVLSMPTGTLASTFSNTLANGSSLSPGTPLVSPGGKSALIVGTDNTLSVYSNGTMMFKQGGGGASPAVLVMQNDNNLVLYTADRKPLWATGTNGGTPGALSAVLTDNQLLVQDSAGTSHYQSTWNAPTTPITNALGLIAVSANK